MNHKPPIGICAEQSLLFEKHHRLIDSLARSANKIGQIALSQHKSVTLWSVPEKDSRSYWQKLTGAPIPQDGLVDNHVYTVVLITRAGTDWKVTLRNPWGTNMGVGEGKDTASATMVVSLQSLVTTGGLESFQVSQ